MRPAGTKPSYCLDWDGLTYHIDPVQQRMAQILSEHEQQIRQLERQLSAARLALNRYSAAGSGAAQCQVDGKDELASSDSGGERASTSGASAVTSDLSWEQVEEKDSRLTLWVPDHIVTHCAGCHQEFWMVRRKHHCRNCGHVFCAECSDYSLPVPQQHLDKPVRVCFQCYRQAASAAAAAATAQPGISDLVPTSDPACKRIFGLNLLIS
jgi:myotubularin-related protein 3/4